MDLLASIVNSAAKARLLPKLLERRGAEFSVSDLGRLAGISKARASNISAQWEECGLVQSRQHGRNKLISLNRNFYMLPELKRICEKSKNPQKQLLKELESMPSLRNRKIRAVAVFGSRARGNFRKSSDFDVLAALDDRNDEVEERIIEGFARATEKTGVRFSAVLLDRDEIKQRIREGDQFIRNILREGKIVRGSEWLEHISAAP
ncbi:MAG TPA: hypothetical protein HA254_07370 [Candidatus Diapherotrites archaeon]|uniref:Polymerase nucleotidyl transferase domain-containing protein n=1 Tax=Candidatus Iainarchaeum sp. TaxID=3101447 RepID=A0A7J4J5G1_9ARCH|nr:hypothetical protein [Candidatus Diapherotrites archaeon]